MKKNRKKNVYIYICIIESLLCTAEIRNNIVNQLYFNKVNFKIIINVETLKKDFTFSV